MPCHGVGTGLAVAIDAATLQPEVLKGPQTLIVPATKPHQLNLRMPAISLARSTCHWFSRVWTAHGA